MFIYFLPVLNLATKQHDQVHKKICASLNAGKAQQLQDDAHSELPVFEQMYLMCLNGLSSYPKAAQEIYRLFRATPAEEDQQVLQTRVDKMKSLARTLARRSGKSSCFNSSQFSAEVSSLGSLKNLHHLSLFSLTQELT